MKKSSFPSQKPLLLSQSKGTTLQTQLQTIFNYLQDHVATASMVSEATLVPQKCITRYKRDLEKAGMLWEIEKRDCQKTGFKAWYLTTDPLKAPKRDIQLNLFGTNSSDAVQAPAEPIIYELHQRIIDPASKEYLVFESCALDGVLKLVPKTYEGPIRESIDCQLVCRGSLESCEDIINNLINGREI